MKTTEEIKKQRDAAKEQLVAATADNVTYLQGFIRALDWLEEEEEKEEEKKD